MGELLALGLTHYPALVHPDEQMAGALRWTLADEAVPAAVKDPATWPAAMRAEYGSDRGRISAAAHRAACVANFRRLRADLDAFAPDAVLIWGDDQYENFKEEIIPPFCLFALDDQEIRPWAHSNADNVLNFDYSDNVWGEPLDTGFKLRGGRAIAKRLAGAMLDGGIDLSYSYRLRDAGTLPHAFLNTVLFLDYDRAGFPYPVIPFQVNCYGSYVIARHGMPSRFGAAGADEDLDPPGPSPARAMRVGAALARAVADSPYRIAVIGSSSWSHAFLHDKAWRLYPDIDSDERYYAAMLDGDYAVWEQATAADLAASGQQEMLNWFCLLGAVRELGLRPAWTDFVRTHVFNSSKVFAAFR